SNAMIADSRHDWPGGRRYLTAGATLWCLAILAAPVLNLAFVYDFFSVVCHQLPERSWHLFQRPLPVCIRCTCIYFGCLAGFILALPTDTRRLRLAFALTIGEFLLEQFVTESAFLRGATGIAIGACAAPFIREGVEQMFSRTTHDGM